MNGDETEQLQAQINVLQQEKQDLLDGMSHTHTPRDSFCHAPPSLPFARARAR